MRLFGRAFFEIEIENFLLKKRLSPPRENPTLMASKTKTKDKPLPASKKEGNKYDKLIKENLPVLAPVLIEVLIGLKDYRLVALPQVKLQSTVEKEPDFMQKVLDARTPEGRILQIEFEGQDEEITDWRMQEYAGLEGKIYTLEIEQHLIYYGKGKPKNIKGRIKHTHYTYRYKVHYISSVSYRRFLYSEDPEVVVFAILAKPDGTSVQEIIRLIIERLIQLKGDEIALKKFIRQLLMLSMKRKLQAETKKQINDMLDYQDIEEDVFYQIGEERGLKQGMEKGIEKGIEKGMEKGEAIKNIIAIRNMLAKNFLLKTIAEILEVRPAFVTKIKNQLKSEPQIVALLKEGIPISAIATQLKVLPVLVEVLKKEHKI